MRTPIVALAALTLLSANVAKAEVYFDTTNNVLGGWDGSSEGSAFVAQSFSLPTATTVSVTLDVGADFPSDGGSFVVYLVGDNGSGTPWTTSITGAITGFGTGSDSVELGSVADTNLSGDTNKLGAITFQISGAQIAGLNTSNNEYWIGVAVDDSSVEWGNTLDNSTPPAVGLAGQYYWDDQNGSSDANTIDGGALQLSVVPEPATLAILGAGIAGLGLTRRGKTKAKT